ncbi:MAG: FlgT C-terminal domain-containing protein [Desulfobacterales bacterium]|jgi:hypothetical protein
MRKSRLIAAALLLIAALPAVLSIAGCSLYSDFRDATRDRSLWWGAGGGKYQMRILLAPVQNRSAFSQQDYLSMFERTLAASLADECDRAQLIAPGDTRFPEGLSQIPQIEPGLTDNQAIAEIGRRSGANAIAFGTIYDISGKSERRGILWFRKAKSFVQFNVGISAFDMETGAKVLDKTVADEVEIDEFDLETLQKEGKITNSDLEEALNDAAEDLAESVCDALEALPWKGFLLSGGNPVQIAAGENVGIKTGDQFDVYAPGKEMDGIDRQRFFLPGKVVARISVVSVEQDRATAAVISSNGALAPGYTIRPAQ